MKKLLNILMTLVLAFVLADGLQAQSLTFTPLKGKRDAKLDAAVKAKEEKQETVSFEQTEQNGKNALKFRKRGKKKTNEPTIHADTLAKRVGVEPAPVEPSPVVEPTPEPEQTKPEVTQPVTVQRRPANEIVVAVILPFYLASENTKQDEMQMRMVEFYKGFLLAVNQAQQEGKHVRVLAYDLTTRPLSDILTDEALLQAQMIVAPMNPADVDQVALFGESHQIPVISPFSYRKELVEGYTHLFQLNAPKTSFYARLQTELIERFHDYQFVFVKDTLFTVDLDPFPNLLRTELRSRGIDYSDYTFNDPYSVVSMDSALNLSGTNVFYVLETPNSEIQATAMLRRFFPSLKNKLFLDANPGMEEVVIPDGVQLTGDTLRSDNALRSDNSRQIAVLGYPEWQKYTNDFMEFFYDLNVWMFTKFYANPFDSQVQAFYEDYRYWFGSDLLPLYPKYGMLGYDVATYAFAKLGSRRVMEADHSDMPVETLQSVLNFEQNEGQCLQNTGFCLVHFKPSTTIEKFEIR
ncbi:MAG: hypothetical protein IJP70_10855 [Bacteroidales bacterium]|nr:hypothetical protein [Bacteroidales bacterium]